MDQADLRPAALAAALTERIAHEAVERGLVTP
jgi:hypothetical protein